LVVFREEKEEKDSQLKEEIVAFSLGTVIRGGTNKRVAIQRRELRKLEEID